MSIARALKARGTLAAAVRPGKQALKSADRSRIVEGNTRVSDSLALDDATKDARPNEARWDYLIGLNDSGGTVVAVEIHRANTGGAREVIEKKRAAEALLRAELSDRHVVREWYFVASGSVKITRNTPEARRLDVARIRFVGSTLHLDRRKGT